MVCGAIYWNLANNNYALRGAKFATFEGGLCVSQFLLGGWLDKNLPKDRNHCSNTYMYDHDWAPTLLEMVGGK
jgi:hypothetical protein